MPTPIEPPNAVTPEVFAEWRNARRGVRTAEDMTNPMWEWLVRTGLGPYVVNEHFGGPPSHEAGPGWTNERYGQSTTELPDGRIVMIAGEHEDYYDPDFYIYNDVIIEHPDRRIEIRGYPPDVFPPTDFHTATLVGDDIVLVGNLGYRDQRRPGTTQVAVLDTATWNVSVRETSGDHPGWVSKHTARLTDDGTQIVIGGGEVVDDVDRPWLVENVDDWSLDLATLTWQRLTELPWQRWHVSRTDGGPSDLWRHRTALLTGDAQSATLDRLYRPPIDHTVEPQRNPEEFNVFRIVVDGVTVRFVESMAGVMVTFEGVLATQLMDQILDHVTDQLAALEPGDISKIRVA